MLPPYERIRTYVDAARCFKKKEKRTLLLVLRSTINRTHTYERARLFFDSRKITITFPMIFFLCALYFFFFSFSFALWAGTLSLSFFLAAYTSTVLSTLQMGTHAAAFFFLLPFFMIRHYASPKIENLFRCVFRIMHCVIMKLQRDKFSRQWWYVP